MSKFGARTSADQVLKGKNLAGKTVIVTGANTGIGFEAARALAAVGARVIFACRSRDKGVAAVSEAQQKHPDCKAEFLPLDLSSFQSIKEFSSSLDADQIDILICNAGVITTDYKETQEGIEQTVGVCHFGHALLTKLLMPRLLKSGDSRVVMVSSESHRTPRKLNFNVFPLPKEKYKFMVAYGQAKLANTLFANELQRLYGDRGLTTCSLHPGALITTDIGRNSWWVEIFMKIISPLTKNPNQGASTTVYCAAYASNEEIAGSYFSHCKKVKSTSEANDPKVAAKLWELTEALFQEKGFA